MRCRPGALFTRAAVYLQLRLPDQLREGVQGIAELLCFCVSEVGIGNKLSELVYGEHISQV